jgi:hypothetical protein
MSKTKNPRFTSPVGIAQYPYLNKPDTKFNPEGEYKVNLEINAEDATDICTFLDEQLAASIAKAKKENPGKKIKEGSAGYELNEETGKVVVKFKLKAKVTTKSGDSWDQKPVIFDAKGKPLVAAPNIGGGTKMKVAYEVIPYFTAIAGAGVSLRVKAVQVIDLVEFKGGADAGAYGFGEEDGYEAATTAAQEDDFTDETQEATADF